MGWSGDDREEYRPPFPESPFLRGEGLKGKEMLYDLIESGGRKQHTCMQGRMPCNILFSPFVREGRRWPKGGSGGYLINIKVTLIGMVDQNPPGRWQWVVSERFFLKFPPSMESILGEGLEIDGWFRFMGQKAKRKKKKNVLFIARQKGKMMEKVPKGTKIEVEWDEMVIPAPCAGVTLWAAYATMTKLSAFGKCRPEDVGK